jgi:Fe-S-cluster-containing hydrogenase component 2
MGFPSTESGIELEILERLFSEEDAVLFLDMTPRLETARSVAARLGRPEEDMARRLEDMSRRGLLFRLARGGSVRYGAIPFVHGLYEFQVNDIDPQLAGLVRQYSDEGFYRSMQGTGGYFLRTVPVQRSVSAEQSIAVYDDAVAMLEQKQDIVIADCICRKSKNVLGQGCQKPLEACFMFGSMGQYYLDRGMGRKIGLDEAVNILTKCQEAGLVTQPSTSRNPAGMCNCCGDCCGVLIAMNRHPRPVDLVFSNHFAVVESEECIGCGDCLERCQMGALSIDADDVAQVNRDRCIGCGLCVTTCPSGAIQLQTKSADERFVPPADTTEQMTLMARNRGII